MKNGQHGQSMIEFALILPLIVLVLVGIFELGELFLLTSPSPMQPAKAFACILLLLLQPHTPKLFLQRSLKLVVLRG